MDFSVCVLYVWREVWLLCGVSDQKEKKGDKCVCFSAFVHTHAHTHTPRA